MIAAFRHNYASLRTINAERCGQRTGRLRALGSSPLLLGRGSSAMTDNGAKRSMDQRLAGLTPAQRGLLVQRLMERRMAAARRNAISPREDDGPAALSYAQELLWLLSQV